MTGPTRASTEGRAYRDLQNKARRENRPTDELLALYALEGFLARLSTSPHAAALILKGGVLLAAFDSRRPTRDVDLAALQLDNDVAFLLRLVREVADIALDDGLAYDTSDAVAEPIREDDPYAGVRVTLSCRLATARIRFHVDINVGDPIWPEAQTVELPRLLGGVLRLRGYPLEMVLAEKLVTAVQRGVTNTRWRDYADMYLLASRHDVAGATLQGALRAVAAHRDATVQPLERMLAGYGDIGQSRWAAWCRKQQLDDRLPARFDEALALVIAFGDPALLGRVSDLGWNHSMAVWLPLPAE